MRRSDLPAKAECQATLDVDRHTAFAGKPRSYKGNGVT